MIKIRYSELAAGLHVRAQKRGRHTIVYLAPGLSAAQRRAALLRAQQNANLGNGPRLTAGGIAAALLRLRLGTLLRNGASAFRAHPLILLPPVIVLTAATMVYIAMAAVTLTIQAPQGGGTGGSRLGVSAPPAGGASSSSAGPSGRYVGDDSPTPGPQVSRSPGGNRGGSHSPSPSPRPSRSAGSSTPSGSPSPGPSTGSPEPSPSVSTTPPGVTPTPEPSATPSPSPSPTCLRILVGICVSL